MKKVLVFLLACLSGSMMFGAVATHYKSVGTGTAAMTTKFNCVIVINGVEQVNPMYELAAFDQNGICRGAKMPVQYNGRCAYLMQLRGNEDDPVFCYNFRVYDHDTESDLEGLEMAFNVEWEGEIYTQICYQGNITMGSLAEPLNADFTRPVEGITFDVIPYEEENGRDNYYLIASPVGDVPAASVTNLLSNYFDLYYFDQEQDNYEWINYEVGEVSVDPEFVSMDGQLKAGRGYLYANSGDGESEVVTLTFPGMAYTTEGGTATFELEYEEGHGMTGWNLMGNPFNVEAYIDRDVYYLMNETGSDVMEADGPIAPMQGIFVLATEPGDLTFSTADPNAKVSKLSLNLVSDSKVVDRASLSFGGSSLPKFQINSSSTKLYIPMDGEDFAVVSSEEMGEMPVNFKAAKSGSYTLAVSTEVSFNYLHLIDNLTGADQDLLANPSYSFEASTTDYASRFKLVFATGNSDDTFAFYSNGSFVISNEGEATVQVIDVTGRMLSSETINGSASISVSGAAGVYMIRLVNGESVKVQKVVVK